MLRMTTYDYVHLMNIDSKSPLVMDRHALKTIQLQRVLLRDKLQSSFPLAVIRWSFSPIRQQLVRLQLRSAVIMRKPLCTHVAAHVHIPNSSK